MEGSKVKLGCPTPTLSEEKKGQRLRGPRSRRGKVTQGKQHESSMNVSHSFSRATRVLPAGSPDAMVAFRIRGKHHAEMVKARLPQRPSALGVLGCRSREGYLEERKGRLKGFGQVA